MVALFSVTVQSQDYSLLVTSLNPAPVIDLCCCFGCHELNISFHRPWIHISRFRINHQNHCWGRLEGNFILSADEYKKKLVVIKRRIFRGDLKNRSPPWSIEAMMLYCF
jgi:hypothetical protein